MSSEMFYLLLMFINTRLLFISFSLQKSTQTTSPAGPQSPLDTNIGKPVDAPARLSYLGLLLASPVKSSQPHLLFGREERLSWLAEAGGAAPATQVMLSNNPFLFVEMFEANKPWLQQLSSRIPFRGCEGNCLCLHRIMTSFVFFLCRLDLEWR